MTFVFTEMVRCGEIGKQAVDSFHRHHPDLILHIFLAPEDVPYISADARNVLHYVLPDTPIYNGFSAGHMGTSMLWTHIFMEHPSEKLVHFDADVFFKGDIVHDIIAKMETADLVGSFRPYKLNHNNRDDVRGYADVVQTYCVGINTSKITIRDTASLQRMIQGIMWTHPVIDFFDPVSFHMLENGGTIAYMDVEDIGGVDRAGGRMNGYSENEIFDSGRRITHFAGVGSGRNFYTMLSKRKKIMVPESYINFGLDRYDIYCRLFLHKSIRPSCKYDIDTIRKNVLSPDILH